MKGLVMKKLLAFFALMLWLVSTIFAQATIEGSVYEQDGLTPIESAEISFSGRSTWSQKLRTSGTCPIL